MFEVTDARKEHRDTQFVGLGNGVCVADAAAGLDDDRHAIFRGEGDSVVKRQEAVGSKDETFGETGGLRLIERDLGGWCGGRGRPRSRWISHA